MESAEEMPAECVENPTRLVSEVFHGESKKKTTVFSCLY